MTTEETDLPPGAPTYAAGPLANPVPVPSAGAVRASGLPVDKFLAPPVAAPASASVVSQAQQWIQRAQEGVRSLFTGPTTASAELGARTGQLESGLDALERRSSGAGGIPVVQPAGAAARIAPAAAAPAAAAPAAAAPAAPPGKAIVVAPHAAADERAASFVKYGSGVTTPEQRKTVDDAAAAAAAAPVAQRAAPAAAYAEPAAPRAAPAAVRVLEPGAVQAFRRRRTS